MKTRLAACVAPRAASILGSQRRFHVALRASQEGGSQKNDGEYTRLIRGARRIANHDRARGPPSGIGHRPDAAEISRPRRRHARRADLRQRHLSLLRSARKAAPGAPNTGRSAPSSEEGREIVMLAIADEATLKSLDKYRDHARGADRSQEGRPKRRRSGCQDRETDLLRDQRDALPGNRSNT